MHIYARHCPSVPLIACASTISELPPAFSYSSIIVSQRCFNTKQMMLHGKLYILHLSAFFPQLALLNLCQYVTKLHVYKYIYKITFCLSHTQPGCKCIYIKSILLQQYFHFLFNLSSFFSASFFQLFIKILPLTPPGPRYQRPPSSGDWIL